MLSKHSYKPQSHYNTKGIVVDVKSSFMPSFKSLTSVKKLMAWGCTVTLSNTDSRKSFQLKSRRICIRNGDGKRTEDIGPGVGQLLGSVQTVGAQFPVLTPGQSYSFDHFVELETIHGTMDGSFTMEEVESLGEKKGWRVSGPSVQVMIAPVGFIIDLEEIPERLLDLKANMKAK